jgi:hypothetical protein
MIDLIRAIFRMTGLTALFSVILIGGLGLLIIFLNSIATTSATDWVIIGIAVIVFIPIMIILDKRKKEREKEPWKHDI